MARSLLIALLLATRIAAAPVPAEEKPKPRAKLLGTVKLNEYVNSVCWTPDAKHLILLTKDKGQLIGRDQLGEDTPAKPIAEFALPVGWIAKFGVTPDGAELYAMSVADRLNSEHRLCYWNLKDLLDGKSKAKPDRSVSLEMDRPNVVCPSSDGKTLFATISQPRDGGGVLPRNVEPQRIGQVIQLSTRTGDRAEERTVLDLPDATLLGSVIHAGSGRVFAHFLSVEEHAIRCFERGAKKEKWDRKMAATPQQNNLGSHYPQLSPDGHRLVVFWCRSIQSIDPNAAPQQGRRPQMLSTPAVSPQLLNADTGELIADLGGDDTTDCQILDFSSDSRFMFGWLRRNTGQEFTVWEMKAGLPLKSWKRGFSDVTAAFAPGRHELAIVERTQQQVLSSVRNPNGEIEQRVYRVDHTGILGVWDLTALGK